MQQQLARTCASSLDIGLHGSNNSHIAEMLWDVEMMPLKTSVIFAPVGSLLSPHIIASVLYGIGCSSSRVLTLSKDSVSCSVSRRGWFELTSDGE